MSAFIVHKNHINVIVSYFMDYRIDYQLWYEMDGHYGYMGMDDAPKVAKLLYSENVRSVNHRYGENTSSANYQFEYIPGAKHAYSIGEIAQALNCLEYQSCETDDYHQTDAYKILTAMRKHLLNKLAEREEADIWEISEVRK